MNMPQNPYSPPQANVADPFPSSAAEPELASRWLRLVGAILDGLLVALITVPSMYFGGYWAEAMAGRQPDLATQLAWTAYGFVVFFLVHGYFLHSDGQTLGKRILGMKIVDLEGAKPPFARLLGLRYLVPQLIAMVPVAGALVTLIGVLLIFREDRRPMHDHLAGTRVVTAR